MSYLLGIDLGTTKNAVVLRNRENPEESYCISAEHNASLRPGEQDMEKTVESVIGLLKQLPEKAGNDIAGIGLTGQMHSIVLWNDTELFPAVTWQDRRISEAGALEELRRKSGVPLSDGFGGATLGFLPLDKIRYTASVPDYLGMRMTGSFRSRIDPSFAASWGIFDWKAGAWNRSAIAGLGIPEALLPEIVPFGACVGTTAGFPGLPDHIPVHAAIGDNQASILGASESPAEEVHVTIGTGAQLSLVLSAEEAFTLPPMEGVEFRPFPGGKILLVIAPLCGGRAWTLLGKTVNDFFTSLGFPALPEKELLDRLDKLALQAAPGSGLTVDPGFLGERYAPGKRGSIRNITLENLTLPNLAGAFAEGIVTSLCEPLLPQLLHGCKRIAGSGNAIRHCASLRFALERRLQLKLKLLDTKEEAANGAIKLIIN